MSNLEYQDSSDKLESLSEALGEHAQLSDEEKLELHDLAAEMEAIYGDIVENQGQIIDEFKNLHGEIWRNLSTKVYCPVATNGFSKDNEYFENRDPEKLQRYLDEKPEILLQWNTYFRDYLFPLLQERREYKGQYDDGGIKSKESIERRFKAQTTGKGLKHVRDLARGRFVVRSIQEMEYLGRILTDLSAFSPGVLKGDIVATTNRYSCYFYRSDEDKSPVPFLSTNVVIAIDNDITFEIQIITRRQALLNKLDHPVNIDHTVVLPEELNEFLYSLSLCAHIRDFMEALADSSY